MVADDEIKPGQRWQNRKTKRVAVVLHVRKFPVRDLPDDAVVGYRYQNRDGLSPKTTWIKRANFLRAFDVVAL